MGQAGQSSTVHTPASFLWHIEHNCTLDGSGRTAYTQIFPWRAQFFFSLIVFGGTEIPIVYSLLCRPSEDSLQRSTIPDGSPSKDWQSTVGCGDCWIRTKDCSFTIWCCYQWATTALNEPPLLPQWATTAPGHNCCHSLCFMNGCVCGIVPVLQVFCSGR